jgi:hypothetical protein
MNGTLPNFLHAPLWHVQGQFYFNSTLDMLVLNTKSSERFGSRGNVSISFGRRPFHISAGTPIILIEFFLVVVSRSRRIEEQLLKNSLHVILANLNIL